MVEKAHWEMFSWYRLLVFWGKDGYKVRDYPTIASTGKESKKVRLSVVDGGV